MSKLLTKQDLIAAGVSPAIFPVFDHLWPGGMALDATNAKRAAATGINIYPLAKQILPPAAWAAYIQTEGALINAHLTVFDARVQQRDAEIAASRLSIVEVMNTASAKLASDVAALSQDVTVLTSWDNDPGVVRQPFADAAAAVAAGIAAFTATHNSILAAYGADTAAADAQLADDKINALIAIIDALPEEPAALNEQTELADQPA